MDFLIPVIIIVIFIVIAASKSGSSVQTSDAVRLTPIVTIVPLEKVFDAITEFAKYNGYRVDTIEKQNGRIVLSESASISSWGNFYPIQIKTRDDGKTIVEVGIRGKISQKGFDINKNHQRCVSGIQSQLSALE